jgi:hypothetical protein
MLHHNVMLTLIDSATPEQRDAIVDGLRALPGAIPGLERVDARVDADLTSGNAAILFRMSFQNEESWRAYSAHPAHVELAQQHIKPILASKAALQYVD